MKKNIIDKLVVPKETPKTWVERIDLLPRLLCLLLALAIWLLVVDVQSEVTENPDVDLGVLTEVIS